MWGCFGLSGLLSKTSYLTKIAGFVGALGVRRVRCAGFSLGSPRGTLEFGHSARCVLRFRLGQFLVLSSFCWGCLALVRCVIPPVVR